MVGDAAAADDDDDDEATGGAMLGLCVGPGKEFNAVLAAEGWAVGFPERFPVV